MQLADRLKFLLENNVHQLWFLLGAPLINQFGTIRYLKVIKFLETKLYIYSLNWTGIKHIWLFQQYSIADI